MKYIASLLLGVSLFAGLQAQPLDRSKRPVAGKAPEVKLSIPDAIVLENGLKVFVVENHKLPVVSFSLRLDMDGIIEGDKAGLSDIAGSLMKTGTTNRSKDQIDADIDQMGASLYTSATGIYASSLRKHSDKLLAILGDLLMNPKYSQEEFEKLQTQTLAGLAQSKDDPSSINRSVTNIVLYGKNHPYGENTTEATVKNIQLSDCQNYVSTYFRPNIAYLAVVGDITPAEAKKMLNDALGAWKKQEVAPTKIEQVMAPASNNIALVNRPGAVQSVINIAYPVSVGRMDKEYFAAEVLNTMLGGNASGRLFQNLREKHAFTYGAYSAYSPGKYIHTFRANASVKTAATDSSVQEFFNEFDRMLKGDVTEKELQATVAYLSGEFARGLEEARTVADYSINIQRLGLSPDFYQNYLKNLAAVTVEDVKAVAKKLLRPNGANIIIVGDTRSFADKLARFGTISYYDNDGNPIKAPSAEKPAISSEEVFANYAKAIGGEAKLKKIKDYTLEMTGEIMGMSLKLTSMKKAPNYSYQKFDAGMFAQTKAYDGKKAFENGMGEKKEITGADLEDYKVDAVLFAETKYKSLGVKSEVVGIEKVEGKDAYAVEVTMPSGKKQMEYYDKESGFKVKESRTEEGPQGPVTANVYFGNYQAYKGIFFPGTVKQEAGPQVIEFKLTSVKLNGKLKATQFTVE